MPRRSSQYLRPLLGGPPGGGDRIIMANFKRKKPRAQVKCLICTSGRFAKNSLSKGVGRGGRASQRKFWPTIKEQEA